MEPVVWKTPGRYRFTAADMTALLGGLRREGRSFLLIGHTTVLYGLSGLPPPCRFCGSIRA